MGKRIIIRSGSVVAEGELNETETAKRIYEALPLKSKANRWGDEVYFSIPVECPPENQKELVDFGELGYWVVGSAFCIFFGPTPASRSPDEIRPASPVNVFGKIVSDPKVFRSVKDGDEIFVERAE
ncbi:MAG: cyclophilin-like fold protein [Armatimonadetes bacterium]|nr:cyclophilin-like fold protein [Armatimonadota bacterium]MDW8027813.1 cyclophilin-like fold protein [Armatimonadota bacterium]